MVSGSDQSRVTRSFDINDLETWQPARFDIYLGGNETQSPWTNPELLIGFPQTAQFLAAGPREEYSHLQKV